MENIQEIVETWTMNNKGTLYLLENIEKEWLSAKLAGKGRSIGEQFVHINNIRSMWINKVWKKIDLKLSKEKSVDKNELKIGLELSSQKMAETLTNLFTENAAKGYKPHPTAFFARMIAHESHHRGQIMATISRNDFKISKSVNFKLWGYWR
jgi:uncharacterized damage-inducible protein DinB